MKMLVYLLQVWLALLCLCYGDDSLQIQTASGPVKGLTVPSIGNKTVDAFLGIPYGAPTGGQNRFRPPKKAVSWDAVFDATRFSSPCYQVVAKDFRQGIWWISSNKESEDCLKLNVWVPKPRPQKAAVLVWFHGGGFAAGSADIPKYSGAIMAAEENVIVVSLNYRLSAFGFLYLDHPQAPGNVGLMDQTLGLQWVRDNIQFFGGDPERVTIFGQSAGAASVDFHLTSPASLDLFQNALTASGTMNTIWATSEPDYAMKQGLLLAEHLGCPIEKNKLDETIRCLQEVSAEKIFDAAVLVEAGFVKMKFRPVVDGKYVKRSSVSLLSGRKLCSSKNVMTGYTKEDGSFLIPSIAPHLIKMDSNSYTHDELKHLISSLTVFNGQLSGMPVNLISLLYSEQKSELPGVSLSLEGIFRFLTDRWFACSITAAAEKMADNGNKVYLYRFDDVPSSRNYPTPLPPWLGATHSDDVFHLLGTTLKEGAETTQEEIKLTKQMMRYISNFAKSGDPNDYYLPSWPRYSTQNATLLHLNSKGLVVGVTPRQKECAFWENIYPEIQAPCNNDV